MVADPKNPVVVDLWLVSDLDLETGSLDEWAALLTEQERAKADRYRIPEDRRRSIIGRALARRALGDRAGVDPGRIVIEVTERGRPEAPDLGLWFSVSHTHGLVGVAVCEHAVGFDAEWLGRSTDVDLVARRWFHADEVSDIRGREGAERGERFFTYWTLKEAYCKALGLGLAVELRSLRFEVADVIRLSRDGADVEGWTHWVSRHGSAHVISVAAAAPSIAVRLR